MKSYKHSNKILRGIAVFLWGFGIFFFTTGLLLHSLPVWFGGFQTAAWACVAILFSKNSDAWEDMADRAGALYK